MAMDKCDIDNIDVATNMNKTYKREQVRSFTRYYK